MPYAICLVLCLQWTTSSNGTFTKIFVLKFEELWKNRLRGTGEEPLKLLWNFIAKSFPIFIVFLIVHWIFDCLVPWILSCLICISLATWPSPWGKLNRRLVDNHMGLCQDISPRQLWGAMVQYVIAFTTCKRGVRVAGWALLWRCAVGQGTSSTRTLSWPRSKWAPGRAEKAYVCDQFCVPKLVAARLCVPLLVEMPYFYLFILLY